MAANEDDQLGSQKPVENKTESVENQKQQNLKKFLEENDANTLKLDLGDGKLRSIHDLQRPHSFKPRPNPLLQNNNHRPRLD